MSGRKTTGDVQALAYLCRPIELAKIPPGAVRFDQGGEPSYFPDAVTLGRAIVPESDNPSRTGFQFRRNLGRLP